MKRIGILTFHRSYNYGAFMQCFSLSNRIMKDFPECRVEVIDYCTERMYENYPSHFLPFILGPRKHRNSPTQMLKNVGKCVVDKNYLKHKRNLYRGFEECVSVLPLSKDRIVSNSYKELFKIIDQEYDVLVVGSDGVWEYKTYPFPNAYYPNYDFRRTKLMSYAASSDRMHEINLTEFSKRYIEETLNRFDYIGVRDIATENFLSNMSLRLKVSHNCDPTVFLDIDSMPGNLDRVKNVLSKNGIDIEKPIIGIMGNNDSCNMLRKMFGNKYQIVSVYTRTKAADYNFDYLTPFEWAKIFSLFRVTVTKFFHGSLLSLKNGTPTIATDYWDKVDNNHITKIQDLYNRLNLKNHYFYMLGDGYVVDELRDRIEYFINNPDYEIISRSLEDESHSYDGFSRCLNKLLKN